MRAKGDSRSYFERRKEIQRTSSREFKSIGRLVNSAERTIAGNSGRIFCSAALVDIDARQANLGLGLQILLCGQCTHKFKSPAICALIIALCA
jgi:hypothetical protein